MTRPVRPIALVLLTACMIYPGITLLYQGLYTVWAGEYFNLVGQQGVWMDLARRLNLPPVLVLGAKSLLGLMWVGGVLGLWAGDAKAYPLALLGLWALARAAGKVSSCVSRSSKLRSDSSSRRAMRRRFRCAR